MSAEGDYYSTTNWSYVLGVGCPECTKTSVRWKAVENTNYYRCTVCEHSWTEGYEPDDADRLVWVYNKIIKVFCPDKTYEEWVAEIDKELLGEGKTNA